MLFQSKTSLTIPFVCPVAGISCSTTAFGPVCLWWTCLSEWVLSSITSSVVYVSTMHKAVSCWGPSDNTSPSSAALLWPWRCRAACRSAWCWRCQSLPRTASSTFCLTNWRVYSSCWAFIDLNNLPVCLLQGSVLNYIDTTNIQYRRKHRGSQGNDWIS